MARRLKLGVGELVDFCCRSGDLGGDNGPGVGALEGLQTHQRIQRRYRDRAEAEVAVSYPARAGGFEIELGGRIDLLFASERPHRIEEIKTVYQWRPELEQDSRHWAQLKCYGAAYALEHDLDTIDLSLNFVNLLSRDEHRRVLSFSRADLVDFVDALLEQYIRWYRLVEARRQSTRREAREMPFPFADFRAQQKKFAAEVYRVIRDGGRLLVEAPTGSGKTMSTLFPAVKAIGEDECEQIVYLSAKVSGQRQAVATLELMQIDLSYLVIQAKARSCVCNDADDEIDADGRCLRCIGFFDRLPAAREALLQRRRLDVAEIQRTAAEFSLCPFELALQMLPWADVVICDFNYVFDPLVQLGYFKTDQRRKVLLVDELHNLVDRARGMYSANLQRRQIRQALAAGNSSEIDRALTSMQSSLDRVLRGQDEDETVDATVPGEIERACQRFGERLGFDIFTDKHVARETLDFSREVFRFAHIGQLFGRHHRSFGYRPLAQRRLKLTCLNAFEYLRDCYPLFHAVCGFSATLSPADYFIRALGLEQECKYLSLDSVFPPQNLAVRVGGYIDTRYREREAYIDPICDSIAACYRARPGNYLVFFSAYHFMQQVHARFIEGHTGIPTRLQQRDADERGQQEFLSGFFEASRQLGFAIMGGRFAEGIDYRGDALIGAIIVGVGLPQASREQQLIQQDFESVELDGFDYAFRFPGLIRVMQSAGRVIRDENDRGVLVLLDRRFRQPGYTRHLPDWWRMQSCTDAKSLEQSLTAFWNSREEADAAD